METLNSAYASVKLRLGWELHFRPAGMIANRLRAIPEARVTVSTRTGETANARSILAVGWMGGKEPGATVFVEAEGPGDAATRAVQVVVEVLDGPEVNHIGVEAELDPANGGGGRVLEKDPWYWNTLSRIANHERLQSVFAGDRSDVGRWKTPGGYLWLAERGYYDDPPDPALLFELENGDHDDDLEPEEIEELAADLRKRLESKPPTEIVGAKPPF